MSVRTPPVTFFRRGNAGPGGAARASSPVATLAVATTQRSGPGATAFSARTVGVPARADLGGGLQPAVLGKALDRAAASLAEVRSRETPTTGPALAEAYVALGNAVALVEAALIGALDALDPKTGGRPAKPAAPFTHVKDRAFALLRESGAAFDGLRHAFADVVHGAIFWPSRPVERAADRGDGHPLRVYENNFKTAKDLTPDERRAAYAQKVAKFEGEGGRYEDILVGRPGLLESLDAMQAYDYVLSEEGTWRLFPTDESAPAKPGHSILAEGGPVFTDAPALLAGELWVLKDSAGDVEAVLLANNSGHFKPEYPDLANALEFVDRLGLPRDKVVLFGGPNNLPSMFAEMEGRLQLDGLVARLPQDPAAILQSLADSKASPMAVRLRSVARADP